MGIGYRTRKTKEEVEMIENIRESEDRENLTLQFFYSQDNK